MSITNLLVECQHNRFYPPDYTLTKQRQVFSNQFQKSYDVDWKKINGLKREKKVDIQLMSGDEKVENGKPLKSRSEVTMKLVFNESYVKELFPNLEELVDQRLKESKQQQEKQKLLEEELVQKNLKEEKARLEQHKVEEQKAAEVAQKEEKAKKEALEKQKEIEDKENEEKKIEKEKQEKADLIIKKRERLLSIIQTKKLRGINYIRIEKLFEDPLLPYQKMFFMYKFTVYSVSFGQWESTRVFQSFKDVNCDKLDLPLDTIRPFGNLIGKMQNHPELVLYFTDEVYNEMIEITTRTCSHIFFSKKEKYIDVYCCFKGYIPFFRKTSPMHTFHDQMRIENYFQHSVQPIFETYMSGRIQTLRMTVNLEASDLLHEMATNCNISFADLKVNNSSHFGELFEFGPLKTPQMLEFGWEWMIQKIISENLVTPSQITQQFIERLSSFNYTDYVIEMKLLIDSAEKNKYHRIFDINKILPKKKNNSVDLKKRLYEVVVTPFQTKLTPFRVRTYSGETYEHNEVYKKITDGSGDVVIVRFDSEDMMVNDFLVSVMNHYVNLPYTMFLSGTKYKVYSFLLGTSSVVFVKEGVDIKMERRDIAFSFLRDMDEMWKFNYVLDVCLEKLKTSQDKDCCVEIVRDYWPDVKSLFMLYSSDPLDEQLKFDVLRYNKIFLYDKYKVRMQDKWICDNNIIKLKNDFFSDFSSRPEKIKVVGEVRLSVTLSKILSLFSFDPSLKSILLKPRVDVLDTLTYDLYNIVQYIKKTKPQGLMNISYCAPKK